MAEETAYLVTGGAGFIGSHLATTLVRAGHRVLTVDDLSTGSLDNIAHLRHEPRFSFVRGSVLDSVVMDRLASQAQVIIHLAAAVGVQLIITQPVQTIETNIAGCEAVLKLGLRYGSRVLIASSSEVYGKGLRVPFAEDDDVLLGPTSKSRWAYAASKMVDEFLGAAYHREHGLEVVTCRFFNTVGPRQSGQYGMVIPRFVRQALANDPITLFGNGMQQRCFCHVEDVVRAVLGLATSPGAVGRVWNIGSAEETTILALAERVVALTGSASPLSFIPYSEAYAPGFEDLMRRVPDLTKIRALLGWEPQRSLDDILMDVIAYEGARSGRPPG
ncbi:MAG: GDP-mannose 4,6-dehydratase [Polyangiaceae bacterium]